MREVGLCVHAVVCRPPTASRSRTCSIHYIKSYKHTYQEMTVTRVELTFAVVW